MTKTRKSIRLNYIRYALVNGISESKIIHKLVNDGVNGIPPLIEDDSDDWFYNRKHPYDAAKSLIKEIKKN